MQRTFQTRIVAVLLALFTGAAIVCAGFNLVQENRYQSPTDGVWWVEAPRGLEAQRVPNNTPGERAGVKPGDLLLAANNRPVHVAADVGREIWRTGAYNTIHYSLERRGFRLPDVPVVLELQDRSIDQGFRFIALVYLAIGLYVLLRRWTAPHSTHFYIFCLVSFVLYSFWYTGKFNEFDDVVYWSKIVAAAVQPALFLHFALAFAGDRRRNRGWLFTLLYLPGAAVVGLQIMAQTIWSATGGAAAPAGPGGRGLQALLLCGDGGVLGALPAGAVSAGAAAAEVADAGNAAGGGAVHAAYAIPYMSDFAMPDADRTRCAAVAGVAAADVQLGDCALPADGCGPDLQARRDLHAGDCGAGRRLLRRGRHRGGGRAHAVPGFGVWGPIVAIIVVGLRSIR